MKDYATYSIHTNSITGLTVHMNRTTSVLLDELGKTIYRFGDGSGGNGGQLGKIQSIVLFTEAKRKIPSKIKAHWLSYEEDQFYMGEFELPRELIAHRFHTKTLGLFYDKGNKNLPLNDKIIITFAPKGKMYVYLGGYTTILIGNFQGKPIDYEWKKWLLDNAVRDEQIKAIKNNQDHYIIAEISKIPILNRENTIKEMMESINPEHEKIQKKIYQEGFFKPVKWQIKAKGQIDNILGISVNMINGENIIIQNEKEIKNYIFNSIPISFTLDFIYKGKAYRDKIDFDNFRWDYNYLYQRFINAFNVNKNVDIIVDFIDEETVNLEYRQDKILLDISDFSDRSFDR